MSFYTVIIVVAQFGTYAAVKGNDNKANGYFIASVSAIFISYLLWFFFGNKYANGKESSDASFV